MPYRPPALHHTTSEPLRFFGREAELALLDHAVRGEGPSVVALVGPGGQGKTAIVQHWFGELALVGPACRAGPAETGQTDCELSPGRRDLPGPRVEGAFLWSFYRG